MVSISAQTLVNIGSWEGVSRLWKVACIRGGWVFLRQSYCIVPVYYIRGAWLQTKKEVYYLYTIQQVLGLKVKDSD